MSRFEGFGAFVSNRSRPSGRIAAVALATAALAGTASAGETKIDYAFLAGLGQDSNPRRVTGDGPGGLFTDLRAGAGVRHELRPSVELFVDGGARARIYDSAASNAGTTSGDMRLGIATTPGERVAVTFGASYAMYRSTFLDRADGSIYQVSTFPETVPPTSVAIPERFDHDSTGAFVKTRFRLNRKVRLQFDSYLTDTRYTHDYAAQTDLDGLDYRVRVFEPGVKLYLNRVASLSFSVALSDVDYDSQPALDAQGMDVPGTSRQYRDVALQTALRVVPAYGWSFRLGLRSSDREDGYAGYYDRGAFSAYALIDRDVGLTGKVRFSVSARNVDYDNATVPGDPLESIRAGEVRRLSGRYERELGSRLRWFAETGVQTTDNRDPLFAYDRDWLMTGIRFER